MDRISRLALLLSASGRVAQPIDDLDPGRRDPITPSTREVAPGSHTYRDTDDLREEADEEEDEERPEHGEGSNLLFGGDDDEEDDFEDDDEEVGRDTLRKSRIKLLAGMIWAELGEPDAVVEESAPNELSIRVQDLSWKVSLDDDGRVTISGFDSGAEQYVGDLDDENTEVQIVKIADNVQQLIAEDIDEKSVPPEPPVHYGPDDTSVVEESGGEMPPAAPGGDEGAMMPSTDLEFPPPGEGAPPAGGPEAFPPPAGGPPAPPPAPGGGMPPAAPGAGAPPAPFPAASRRRRMTIPARTVRVANMRLDEVSNQLDGIGESLGEDGEEVFSKLAERVRRVVDLLG